MVTSVQKLTQAYSKTPWRKQVQLVGAILLCVLFAVLGASIYLNLNARIATFGREILLIQEEIQRVGLENADLTTQLGLIKSPAFLEQRAREMGFEPISRDEQLYIAVPGYTLQDSPRLAPPPISIEKVTLTIPPDFTESLLNWIQGKLFINPVEGVE
jgi:hypothetical protein